VRLGRPTGGPRAASLSAPSMQACQQTDFLPPRLIQAFKDAYIDGDHREGDGPPNDAADPLISPAHAAPADLTAAFPRTLITFGTGEELQDQQRAFIAKLRQAHVPLEVYEQTGMPHVAPIFAAAAYGASKAATTRLASQSESDAGIWHDARQSLSHGLSGAAVAPSGSFTRTAPLLDERLAEEAPPPVEALNRIERFVGVVWGHEALAFGEGQVPHIV